MMNNKTGNILVVEDEVPMARAIMDRLKSEGFQVTVAQNGREGLEKFLAGNFDVILLDIKMPEVNGIQMMRQVREKLSQIPIIIYTNLTPDSEILKAVTEDKPSYYFSKTEYSLDQVIKAIRELLPST